MGKKLQKFIFFYLKYHCIDIADLFQKRFDIPVVEVPSITLEEIYSFWKKNKINQKLNTKNNNLYHQIYSSTPKTRKPINKTNVTVSPEKPIATSKPNKTNENVIPTNAHIQTNITSKSPSPTKNNALALTANEIALAGEKYLESIDRVLERIKEKLNHNEASPSKEIPISNKLNELKDKFTCQRDKCFISSETLPPKDSNEIELKSQNLASNDAENNTPLIIASACKRKSITFAPEDTYHLFTPELVPEVAEDVTKKHTNNKRQKINKLFDVPGDNLNVAPETCQEDKQLIPPEQEKGKKSSRIKLKAMDPTITLNNNTHTLNQAQQDSVISKLPVKKKKKNQLPTQQQGTVIGNDEVNQIIPIVQKEEIPTQNKAEMGDKQFEFRPYDLNLTIEAIRKAKKEKIKEVKKVNQVNGDVLPITKLLMNGDVGHDKKGNYEEKKPFRRVEVYGNIKIDPKLADNSFEASKRGDDWGVRANDTLKFTKGKSFKHEKTKKKRGNYAGGSINLSAVNSIQFSDDDN